MKLSFDGVCSSEKICVLFLAYDAFVKQKEMIGVAIMPIDKLFALIFIKLLEQKI